MVTRGFGKQEDHFRRVDVILAKVSCVFAIMVLLLIAGYSVGKAILELRQSLETISNTHFLILEMRSRMREDLAMIVGGTFLPVSVLLVCRIFSVGLKRLETKEALIFLASIFWITLGCVEVFATGFHFSGTDPVSAWHMLRDCVGNFAESRWS